MSSIVHRNRIKHTTSLEERMLKFAQEAREAAERVPAGPEREKLLKKARVVQTMADAANRLKE